MRSLGRLRRPTEGSATNWAGYDDRVHKHYSAGEVLVIDMNHTGMVNNPDGAARVAWEVEEALTATGRRIWLRGR
ncbi:hypothetical protein [Streptomyces sp. NPDC005828]|uniref:hypothetical protein n=1 Tax=Streptomyces sp. NPDC005828 TaxID=3157071 RepID=UPI0033C5FC02